MLEKLLTPEQQAKRVACCKDCLEADEREDFLNRVINQGVEASRGAENKEVAKIKVQCEDNVDCFLRFSAHCSPGICPS